MSSLQLLLLPTPDRLQGRDGAGHEGGLHLQHRVVDRGAEALVEDLDPEQLGRGGGPVLVGGGDGHVEGQDLVGVPGLGDFLEALDFGERDIIQLLGDGVEGGT